MSGRSSIPPAVLQARWNPRLLAPELAIFAFAALLQTMIPPGSDVSWLLVVGERMLAGERLYVDTWETNPPLSPLLYLPAVVAEQLSGMRAETVVLCQVLFAAAISIALSMRILRAADLPTDGGLRLGLAFILTVLPLGAFGQREHVGLILEIPIFAVAATLAAGRPCAAWTRLAAGLAAGLAMAIKPHFAVPILFVYLYVAWTRRTARDLLRLEIGIAAFVVISYSAAVLILFPEFVSAMLPIVEETYRQTRSPVGVLGYPVSLLYVVLFLSSVARLRSARSPIFATICLAASCGFFLAYVEQGKGWAYHLYPGLALVLFALLVQTTAELDGAAELRPKL